MNAWFALMAYKNNTCNKGLDSKFKQSFAETTHTYRVEWMWIGGQIRASKRACECKTNTLKNKNKNKKTKKGAWLSW